MREDVRNTMRDVRNWKMCAHVGDRNRSAQEEVGRRGEWERRELRPHRSSGHGQMITFDQRRLARKAS
jgi:hypothetical protein